MKLSYPKFNKNSIKKVQAVLKSGKVNYWTGMSVNNLKKNFLSILETNTQ